MDSCGGGDGGVVNGAAQDGRGAHGMKGLERGQVGFRLGTRLGAHLNVGHSAANVDQIHLQERLQTGFFGVAQKKGNQRSKLLPNSSIGIGNNVRDSVKDSADMHGECIRMQ